MLLHLSVVSERSLLRKCAEKKISRKPRALLRERLIIYDDREPLETTIVRLVCEKFNREIWAINIEMGE